MENVFLFLNKETKINLALSYENFDIIEKFCSDYEIETESAKEYFKEIKKFLYLCANTTDKLAPSEEIDKIWHSFILFTREYRLYCTYFLGKFIDHVPEVKKKTVEPKENCLLNTIIQYEEVFGELKNEIWKVTFKNKIEEESCANCNADCLNYNANCSNCDSGCSNCSGRGSQPTCVYSGTCFSCTDSGYSCVGENPNNL